MKSIHETQVNNIQLTVNSEGIRVDKYLAESLPHLSRTKIKKLLEEGSITINELFAKANQKLKYHDIIRIEVQQPKQLQADILQLNVIYEDKELMVIDKPAGMVVHPGPGHPDHTLVNAIIAHCPEIGVSSDLLRPGIVHRLDKDTSGLIVIAKNNKVKENLVEQFKNHAVMKIYVVLVKGQLFPDRGIIEAAIGRDPHNFKHMAVVENGKEAITCYTVRKRFSEYTLLDVNLKTGRTHQIRVHMSAIGHSVAGDLIYGQASPYVKRQFIHAMHLSFQLPSTGIYHHFNSPLPLDLEETLSALGNSI